MFDSSNYSKYLKFHRQKVESTRNGKRRRLSGAFQTLIWRAGKTVQNLECPELSGRVDNPALEIKKNVQCVLLLSIKNK